MIRLCLPLVLILCSNSLASVQVFVDNYSGFHSAAGALQTIDFETLPNGTPTPLPNIPITSTFNYDAMGAHFSAPIGNLLTQGSPGGPPLRGFGLTSIVSFPQRTWITADLTTPSTAVGVHFGGNNTVFAYDALGNLLASPNVFIGGPHFIGIISDVPISRVVSDSGGSIATITAFQFTPIPEPATLALGVLGFAALRSRRR